jgi:CDP-4-dehydro-6-deoxyglucose reductase
MNHHVVVHPSGRSFEVGASETVLEAAIRQGVNLPYGCRNGACGSCKGKVLRGQVDIGVHQEKALSAAEAEGGFALFCCTRPLGDIEIECREVNGLSDYPVKKMPVRVASIARAADDVAIVRLQLPANERPQFRAGQYLEVLMRDGSRRAYSMAVAPHLAEQIELHIRHLPGGKFTDPLFGATEPVMKERDILRIEMPLGTFFLREDSDKPVVLLASGTGYAPIKAIIEHAISAGIKRPMRLYWGARARKDLYAHESAVLLAQHARAAGLDLQYTPVLSEPQVHDDWTGRTGFVHLAVLHDLPDLSAWQVYACGVPVMVDTARKDFVRLAGLPTDEFHADAFVSEADKVGVA